MILYRFILAAATTCLALPSASAQSSDPFIGIWRYNAEKSPQPTITYSIRDLGGERYALTGSSGETTEIKADGHPIKSPSGDTVSFSKLDDHTWHMDRTSDNQLARTYTVSPDDSTLTLTDLFSAAQSTALQEKTVTQYHRTSPGKSIYGSWKSFAMTDTVSVPPSLSIRPFGADGISLILDRQEYRTDLRFDGKPYPQTGPDGPTGTVTIGKRVSPTHLHLEDQRKGKLEERDEFELSPDGKTLTIVGRPANAPTVFTSLWDRQ
jgi:hypothetical protein